MEIRKILLNYIYTYVEKVTKYVRVNNFGVNAT